MITFLVLLLVGVVAATAVTIILLNKFPKSAAIFKIVYGILIIVFGYFLFESIMNPIRFNREKKIREDVTIERLKDIRTLQISYKDKYGNYTGGFDTLISFYTADSFEIPKTTIVGVWDQDELSKENAIKQGLIIVNTSYIAVSDSLLKDKDYEIERLKYIPTTDSLFRLGATEIETGSGVKVKVFEAAAPYDILFHGMDKQLVINYKDTRSKISKYEGIRVGSLTEATNNAGNWEK